MLLMPYRSIASPASPIYCLIIAYCVKNKLLISYHEKLALGYVI
ncbi:hypothetical protein SAMN06269173_11329 [Hymenobacter mucosus]|uniref:Uncharacterized protein n=1 Tax=Hymenobacter mucosus TaxID=1411120 RepID=A0A239AJI9_9BACT|nr:hypothetical protein SAMN06269173_11329 [Hymenobacter mucosus]